MRTRKCWYQRVDIRRQIVFSSDVSHVLSIFHLHYGHGASVEMAGCKIVAVSDRMRRQLAVVVWSQSTMKSFSSWYFTVYPLYFQTAVVAALILLNSQVQLVDTQCKCLSVLNIKDVSFWPISERICKLACSYNHFQFVTDWQRNNNSNANAVARAKTGLFGGWLKLSFREYFIDMCTTPYRFTSLFIYYIAYWVLGNHIEFL